tara:strand:+ start:2271 stop:2714 length:444 start_codon:yes stop_codon:yes gene_type:complete
VVELVYTGDLKSPAKSMRVRIPPAPLYRGESMPKDILKVLVEALGGQGDKILEEFDKFSSEYPNLTLLMIDAVRNGALMAQDINDVNQKTEILKDLLIQANVIKSVKVPKEESEKEQVVLSKVEPLDEIKINDILWNFNGDDKDLPN